MDHFLKTYFVLSLLSFHPKISILSTWRNQKIQLGNLHPSETETPKLTLTESKWWQSSNRWLVIGVCSGTTNWTSIPVSVAMPPHTFSSLWTGIKNWIEMFLRITFSFGYDFLGGSETTLLGPGLSQMSF